MTLIERSGYCACALPIAASTPITATSAAEFVFIAALLKGNAC